MQRVFLQIALFIVLASPGATRADSADVRKTLSDLAAIKGEYTFAVIGDNRSGDRVYKKIVKGILSRNPMFIVNTGDVIPHPGNRDQWANFRKISGPIKIPYFLTPGNHDIDSPKSEGVWREEVDLPGGETYYSFVVGKDLFVVLNSCEPDHDRRIVGRQFAWLAHTLDPTRYDRQFVFIHHPLFLWKGASREGKSLDRYPEFRDKLHDLFVLKGVDAVFVGHEHTFRRQKIGNIDYIVTGGGGAPLYSGYNHFMIIRVAPQRIEAKVIDREGYMRDEFLIGN